MEIPPKHENSEPRHQPTEAGRARELAYWRANLRVVGILLGVWFFVSYGAGILWVDLFDKVHIAGFPLGFWFAQQGAIYVFVALIFIYVAIMNRMDQRFGVDSN